jgi:polar amino acid transport system permease protein
VSAYCSEIIRAGILGVPKGQFEAARALGLPAWVTWWKVIRPQAMRIIIPPLTGTIISIFKATAILSILAINDLMRAAARISSYTIRPLEIYTTAAVLALLTGLVITWIGARAEIYYRQRGH